MKVLNTIILWQDAGPCCEQTHAAFEVGLSLDHSQGVYSGWSDVVVSSQLRLCHTYIIDVMTYHVNRSLTHPLCRIYIAENWVGIGSSNGLSPVRRQAITWTSADVLSIWSLTNLSEILIKMHKCQFHSWRCLWKSRLRMAAIYPWGVGVGEWVNF